MLQIAEIYWLILHPYCSLTITLASELAFFCILITSLRIPLISLCILKHYHFLWTDFSQLLNASSKIQPLNASFSLERKCRKENCVVWRHPFSHYFTSEDLSGVSWFIQWSPSLFHSWFIHQFMVCITLYQRLPKLISGKFIYKNVTALRI